uniref:Kinesin-like protein n=1 Tax=Trypanosoma vivax (strain Y486) TaxID=1055687 RepID=G0UAH6_TRYVY|nr:putative kinesin, fragment [Trypanosoma vivax Y486]
MSIEVHVRIRPNVQNSIWSSAETVLYSTNNPNTHYVYNKVHHIGTTNQSIFQGIEALVHAGFDGKNVTVMAYGQTGSGKTHSMNGTAEDPGVVPRTAKLLLDLRRNFPGTQVFVYFTEIYNESVKDLLEPQRGDLPLHDAPDGGVYFDKKSVSIETLEDFAKLQNTAEKNRKYGVTNLNDHSSRSHIILTFEVNRSNRQVSTINLVDLAGSESASRANTEGVLLREGGFINKSLLTLGNVVDAIVDKRPYVPYRDAKLTRILRNCLGGSGMTFILCCINPSMENFEQTVSSLRFTQRAMKIKNDPIMVLNMPPLFAHQYGKYVQQLNSSVEGLSDAYYQRGLRDAYLHNSGAVSSIVSNFEGQVSDSMHAMANAQRLLIAHDHAMAIEQIGRLYNRLAEVSRQRDQGHEMEEVEHKRQREAAEEIESRAAKVARLEERVKERDVDADSKLAGWEYQLYEARQRRVTPLELLLTSERVSRFRLQYEWAVCMERIAARCVPSIKSLGPMTPPVADKRVAAQQMRQRLRQAREELNDLTVAHDMIKGDLQNQLRAAAHVDDDVSEAYIDERIHELEREENSLLTRAGHMSRCESVRRIRESLTRSRPQTPHASQPSMHRHSVSPPPRRRRHGADSQTRVAFNSSLTDVCSTVERNWSPTPRTARTAFPILTHNADEDAFLANELKENVSPRNEKLTDGVRKALGVLRDVRSKLMHHTNEGRRQGGMPELASRFPDTARSGSCHTPHTPSPAPLNEDVHFVDMHKRKENGNGACAPVVGIAARRRMEGVPPRPNVERALWRMSQSPIGTTTESKERSRSRRR